MKQTLLALALIAVPVAAFSAWQVFLAPTSAIASADASAPAADPLGDLSPLQAIVTDARAIAAKGDMVATEKRMTDFETAWDDQASALRALDSSAWGNVDDAHDAVLNELRGSSPAPAKVDADLAALVAALADPTLGGGAPSGLPADQSSIAGVSITDANGRALPCEEMLKSVRAEKAGASLSDADTATLDDFLAKGTERCNADDDKRADEFLAQGLALLRR